LVNTLGQLFRVTTFGESHGPAVGCVVDGVPAGIAWNHDLLIRELARRRPGQSTLTTRRDEADTPQVLSGVFEGYTTGAPIALTVANTDAKSTDYDHLRTVLRPSHADLTYHLKYGYRDHRGGGRSSARATVGLVAAGAVARMLLAQVAPQVQIMGWTHQVGTIVLPEAWPEVSIAEVEAHATRCPHPATATQMEELIREVRKAGDTVGGIVACRVRGIPAGLGEPVFGKLHALLGAAVLGINACKGFEIGSGFASASQRGSTHNDPQAHDAQTGFHTLKNDAGGVLGGISTGDDLLFRAAFKPVATLLQPQPGVDIHGQAVTVEGRGRHDPCVVPRAVPIVEAVTACVLADAWLMAQAATGFVKIL
jgi:chorismate synthase